MSTAERAGRPGFLSHTISSASQRVCRASVEAIFLSTFVLISQNRTAAAADKRADLDLHINLLAEHELTKLAEVVTAIAARLDVPLGAISGVEEIKKDVAPEAVLDELDTQRIRD